MRNAQVYTFSWVLRPLLLPMVSFCLLPLAPTFAHGTQIDLSIPSQAVEARPIPEGIRVDLDLDGIYDLLSIETDVGLPGAWVRVHHGLGEGRFETRDYSTPAIGYSSGFSLEVHSLVDLNSDGYQDLILVLSGLSGGCVFDDLITMINGGDGSFTNGQRHNIVFDVEQLLVTDLGTDGSLDLAVVTLDESSCETPEVRGKLYVIRNQGDGRFDGPVQYPQGAGSEPKGPIAAGDLNGDGAPDLLVAGLRVYLPNIGEAAFWMPVDLPTLPDAEWVEIADLDGIAPEDLVLGSATDVSVLLNQGDDPPLAGTYAFGSTAHRLVRDLDQDGRMDLLLASEDDATILANDGLGGFAAIALPHGSTLQPAVCDVDSNGFEDIILSTDNDFSVVFNREGHSYDWTTYGKGTSRPLFLEDLNLDGRVDIVLLRSAASTVLINEGGGVYSATEYSGSRDPLLADINNDGLPDFIHRHGAGFSTLLSTGGGAFTRGPGYFAEPVRVEDVDLDGNLDLLALGELATSHVVIAGYGDGRFVAPVSSSIPGIPLGYGDFDADGHDDILLRLGDRFGVFEGPDFSKSDVTRSSHARTRAANLLQRSFAMADFNVDGRVDVAVARDGGIEIHANNGVAPFFGTPTRIEDGTSPSILAAADFDEDGAPDLVTDGWLDFAILRRNSGDGSFGAPVFLAGAGPQALAAADFNADGHADIAMGSGSTLRVLFGRGDGTFDEPANDTSAPVQAGGMGAVLIPFDINHDGAMDLLGGSCVWLNDGAGGFQQRVSHSGYSEWVATGDLDHDGDIDLITTGRGISIHENLGNAEAFTSRSFSYLKAVECIIGEFSGDGMPDLATGSRLLINRTAVETAIEILDLRSSRSPGRVILQWRLEGSQPDVVGLEVWRSSDASGPYTRLTAPPLELRPNMEFRDATPQHGEPLWYRLMRVSQGGERSMAASIHVAGESAPLVSRVQSVRQVAARRVEIHYHLTRPGSVRLTVYDVRGRRIMKHTRQFAESADYVHVWAAQDDRGRPLAPGIYFLRFETVGVKTTHRVPLVR